MKGGILAAILSLTPASTSGAARNTTVSLTAVVNVDGSLARGRGAVSSSQLGVDGQYEVIFNRDVSNCAYVASGGEATTFPPDDAVVFTVAPRDGNPNAVFVQVGRRPWARLVLLWLPPRGGLLRAFPGRVPARLSGYFLSNVVGDVRRRAAYPPSTSTDRGGVALELRVVMQGREALLAPDPRRSRSPRDEVVDRRGINGLRTGHAADDVGSRDGSSTPAGATTA